MLWKILCIPSSFAGDLASEVRQGVNSPSSDNGGYFELGGILYAYVSPQYGLPEGNRANSIHVEAGLSVNGRYQYNRFFVEVFSESLEEFTMGYNIVNGNRWALDWVGLQEHSEMTDDVSDDFKAINPRDGDFTTGIRSTWYWRPYILQMHVLKDFSGVHEGEVYSLKMARYWLYHNWNFHAIVGTTYRSDEVADYYFSIHADEVSAAFPQFRAKAGFTNSFEVGVTYPISEKWVFRAAARHMQIPNQWQDSPLFVGGHSDEIATSFNYVF